MIIDYLLLLSMPALILLECENIQKNIVGNRTEDNRNSAVQIYHQLLSSMLDSTIVIAGKQVVVVIVRTIVE